MRYLTPEETRSWFSTRRYDPHGIPARAVVSPKPAPRTIVTAADAAAALTAIGYHVEEIPELHGTNGTDYWLAPGGAILCSATLLTLAKQKLPTPTSRVTA